MIILANKFYIKIICRSNQNKPPLFFSSPFLLLHNEQLTANRLFFHSFDPKTKNFENPLIDILIDSEDEIKNLMKYISKSEYEANPYVDTTILYDDANAGPVERNEELNLVIKIPESSQKFLPKSSVMWLEKYGLEQQKLELGRFLKPFKISKSSGVQDRKNQRHNDQEPFGKVCETKIYSKTNIITYKNFNMNIKVENITGYRKKLQDYENILRSRLNFLSNHSRGVFGNLGSGNSNPESPIMLIFDISNENKIYLDFMKKQFKYLVAEQLVNFKAFNLICCSSDQFHILHNDFLPVTEENLAEVIDFFPAACSKTSGMRDFRKVAQYFGDDGFDENAERKTEVMVMMSGSFEKYDLETFRNNCSLHVVLLSISDDGISGRNPSVGEKPSEQPQQSSRSSIYNLSTSHLENQNFETHASKKSKINKILTEDAKDSALQIKNFENLTNFHWICVDKGLVESFDTEILLFEAQQIKEITDELDIIEDKINAAQLNNSSVVKIQPKKSKIKATKVPRVAELQKKDFTRRERPRSGPLKVPENLFFPSIDEYVSEKFWLSENSLKAKKINLGRFTRRNCLKHKKSYIKSIKTSVTSKYYQELFPVENHSDDDLQQPRQGFPNLPHNTKIHIDLTAKELKAYKTNLCKALLRYSKRIAWHLDDTLRSTIGTKIGQTKKPIIIAIEAIDVDKNFKSLLCRTIIQQVLNLKANNDSSKRIFPINVCLFSDIGRLTFWYQEKGDFEVTYDLNNQSLDDLELWLSCAYDNNNDEESYYSPSINSSSSRSPIGLERLLDYANTKTSDNDNSKTDSIAQLIVVTNRQSSDANFSCLIESLKRKFMLDEEDKNKKGNKLSSIIFTNPNIDDHTSNQYKQLFSSSFKAFSSQKKHYLREKMNTISDKYVEVDKIDENLEKLNVFRNSMKEGYYSLEEDQLPNVKDHSLDFNRLFSEFNRTVFSLLEVSGSYRHVREFFEG